MKTEHIIEIITKKEDGITNYIGGFGASGGSFEVNVSSDGNAARHEITLWGNQYDMDDATQKIVIYGEWEIAEVAELFKIISKSN